MAGRFKTKESANSIATKRIFLLCFSGASNTSGTPVNTNKVQDTQLASTVDKSNLASRKKFAAVDDVVLVRAVNAFQPWRAPVEKLEATNRIKETKQAGIESSGELMRRLAMNESVAGKGDDENEDGDEDSDAASQVGRKPSAQQGSAQKGKITKRERLAVFTDALTDSLKSASEDDGNKHEFKAKRLAFEQDQAENQRLHEATEAEKRRHHELDLETRRQKADEEREKRMFAILKSVLMQKKFYGVAMPR
ncbi:hypothetical protein F441_21444 [Phytophthora nicotianae CJ01A1]|uniref:No apical meristem-associated C-terminal domain-containing protein n=2 Tax=Phytophthora nicotianae TaxID=4792 RepID=V9DZN4_PHYNI|nr:hypothetical protein F443_21565 [Phytophthora nicotianae P1569]ETP01287.1 hypothetical protein F441_21444 [Phytophthora nicotianae CJ01A1]